MYVNTWQRCRVFTYIHSFLIEKDSCVRWNISIKFPCVYMCLSYGDLFNFWYEFSLSFPLFCVIRTSVLSFAHGLYIYLLAIHPYKWYIVLQTNPCKIHVVVSNQSLYLNELWTTENKWYIKYEINKTLLSIITANDDADSKCTNKMTHTFHVFTVKMGKKY